MWLILAAIFAVVVWIALGQRSPRAVSAAQLGHVSDRWIAEYRASHPAGS